MRQNFPQRQRHPTRNLRLLYIQQQRLSKDANGGATHTVEGVKVAAMTEASGGEEETVSDEICGGAAVVTKRVTVDIMNDNTVI